MWRACWTAALPKRACRTLSWSTSTANRLLQLFVRVVKAVQCAHQNLVVHRDLKPGNIFVTPQGEPKLLDFGIAKLLYLNTDPAGATMTLEDRLMTPEYAMFPGNPIIAGSWMHLAENDRRLGNLPLAASEIQKALDIRKQHFGPEHIFIAESERALAQVEMQQGNLSQAKRLAEHALSIDRAALPHPHPQTAQAEATLQALQRAAGANR